MTPARPAFAIVTAVCLALALGAGPARAELKDGEILSSANWQEAKDLLPPEVLEHYKTGDYTTMVAEPALPKYKPTLLPREWREATEANVGKYKLGPEGNILNQDGTPAGFIMGIPFPKIDPKDPDAGRKIVWDYYYERWYDGDGHFYAQVTWLSRTGVERNLVNDAHFRYFQGWAGARKIDNPMRLLVQNRGMIVEPADVNGTSTLGWRFVDPGKRDQNWAFVPALRRVRQTSPTNRSDGVLGSDLAEDDGQYFDAKLEDFDFKLVGEKEMYGLVDGTALEGRTEMKILPGGGYRFVWDDTPWLVYQTPGASGVAWGPAPTVRLVKNKYWIIEATPKDRYYLFGKIVLRISQETYRGSYLSKHSWKDELLNLYQVQNGLYWSPDGGYTGVRAGKVVYAVEENVKVDRATVVGFDRHAGTPADYQAPIDASVFESENLLRAGK